MQRKKIRYAKKTAKGYLTTKLSILRTRKSFEARTPERAVVTRIALI
jgi:hypothetical protein